MKKNITINLCGRLFQIDEDAYEMLQHYTDSLRSYFSKQEGGEEIADDIEARIAELLDELKQQGIEAVNIDHVKDIIRRIGKPEELAGDDGEEQRSHAAGESIIDNMRSRMTGRKFYRNPNDKMVAGVMSGFASYTGTDVTIWRLLTVLFTFFYGIGLVAYVILAFVIPEAKTPEELLEMEGKPATPQNLADMMVENKQEQPRPGLLRFVCSVLLKIVFGFTVFIMALSCLAMILGFVFVVVAMVSALVLPLSADMPFSLEAMGLAEVYQNHMWVLIVFAVALLVLLLVPIYAIIHLVLTLLKKVQPMSVMQRIVWVVLWLLALCAVVPTGIMIGSYHDDYRMKRYKETHVYQGAVMSDYDKQYLMKHGWTLLKHENCNDCYVRNGEYFTGDHSYAYLNTWNGDGNQVFQVERRMAVEPGSYRVSCHARAKWDGVYIYATTPSSPDKPLAKTLVPAYGNEGGQIWEKARDIVNQDEEETSENSRSWNIYQANDSRGYGWSEVEVVVQIERNDTLCYGISNDPAFTGDNSRSEWFSACDFKVEPLDKEQQQDKGQLQVKRKGK